MSLNYSLERRLIGELIQTQHPDTVGELARMIAERGDFEETTYIAAIKSMVDEGILTLKEPSYNISSALDYLFTVTISGGFWLVLILASMSLVTVDFVPNAFPYTIFRWTFGLILICLPGYSTIQLLFPSAELRFPERLALSVALSLAIIPMIGFILNFTPWGIRFQPVVASLAVYTIIAVTAASYRDYLTLVHLAEDKSAE